MHTLFAFPWSCSFAVHAALLQHDVPVQLEWVERGQARKVAGDAYARVNAKRKVPALRLPDGEVLTEIVGILHFLDGCHVAGRAPAGRRRLLEWLSFVATELHQGILGPVFDPDTPDAARVDAHERLLPPVVAHLDATLSQRETLLGGSTPSVADAYALWGVLLLRNQWREAVATPALTAFRLRMQAHSFVQGAMAGQAATTPTDEEDARASA